MRSSIASIISELDYGACQPGVNTEPYLFLDVEFGDRVDWIENGQLRHGIYRSHKGAFAHVFRGDANGMIKINVFALNPIA